MTLPVNTCSAARGMSDNSIGRTGRPGLLRVLYLCVFQSLRMFFPFPVPPEAKGLESPCSLSLRWIPRYKPFALEILDPCHCNCPVHLHEILGNLENAPASRRWPCKCYTVENLLHGKAKNIFPLPGR